MISDGKHRVAMIFNYIHISTTQQNKIARHVKILAINNIYIYYILYMYHANEKKGCKKCTHQTKLLIS